MVIKNLLFGFWRLWLWFLVLFGLIAFSPLGVIFISYSKTYPLFHLFCRYWCRFVLLLNGFWYKTEGFSKLNSSQSYVICPNHSSKFDIVLLFAVFPKTFVFVGKKGVTSFSVFEWFYNKTMITFDRDSIASSFQAYRKADKLLKKGVSIVLFPEGRVPEKKIRLGKFKLGAFKLAMYNQVPIIPITFVDNKSKYPEDELKLKLGLLRVCIHPPVLTKGLNNEDVEQVRDRVFNTINDTLINYENR